MKKPLLFPIPNNQKSQSSDFCFNDSSMAQPTIGMKSMTSLMRFLTVVICLLIGQKGVFAQDLGSAAYSKLTWDHISSVLQDATSASSIGLTTDKKIYVWGTNIAYTIHSRATSGSIPTQPIWQTTPYYVPSPAGQTIKKVRVHGTYTSSGYTPPAFFALSETGNMYAWGFNGGLLRTAWTNSGTILPADNDSTKTSRVPVLISIPGESSIVDFDVPRTKSEYWIAIGASGKAYHIGISDGLSTAPTTVFNTLPNPVGVAVGFKYINVWVSPFNSTPFIYLKGNDGKIYYTGVMLPASATGVPSINYYNSPLPTVTTNEQQGKILLISPREVPFPAGEDIVSMKLTNHGSANENSNYALSASGKAYITGLWKIWFNRSGSPAYNDYRTYVVAPLKTAPVLNTDYNVAFVNSGAVDSLYTLKIFKEVALPPGATKIIEIETPSREDANTQATLVIGNDNKVWWSGTNASVSPNIISSGNYLSNSNALANQVDYCRDVYNAHTTNILQWTVEAVNYRGASKLFRTANYTSGTQLGIISNTGRGYFVGQMTTNTGTAKIYGPQYSFYPIPIANELLADCNPSPGSGGTWSSGPVAPTNTAVGTIDCSKTQLSPAPTFGSASQLDLIVTVNVTTAGNFTPITVSGSGMTLANNITAITTATTGIQSFHIPMNYDGTALATMNFTVGSSGSCSADLTTKATQIIKNVWTLGSCSAIIPGVISK